MSDPVPAPTQFESSTEPSPLPPQKMKTFSSIADLVDGIRNSPELRRQVHSYPVPGLGKLFHLEMSGNERDEYHRFQGMRILEARKQNPGQDVLPDFKGTRAFLLALTLCDETGKLLTDTPWKDYKLIQDNFRGSLIYDLTDEIVLINGLNSEEEDKTEKN